MKWIDYPSSDECLCSSSMVIKAGSLTNSQLEDMYGCAMLCSFSDDKQSS